ncbi:TspO/MBR family protein [Aureimonas populi]|uniref:TspO/MBR family protein n=1 Tax=Aureimonas populi TaxID=1701758 RepID=A0ABW5CIM9_9HYPH|nr:TspO/MBR family protein [Aureimonas populi]
MSRKYGVLALFLVVSVGGGLLIGSQTQTAGWYRSLRKPAFTPPDLAFPIAWTILYVLIGFAGWRVWRSRNRPALAAWAGQLALNFAWTPVFFVAHAILPALAVILTLLGTIFGFLATTASRDRAAFWSFVPYALWVAYATLLNASIWWLN